MRYVLFFGGLLVLTQWMKLVALLPADIQGGIGLMLVLGAIFGAFGSLSD